MRKGKGKGVCSVSPAESTHVAVSLLAASCSGQAHPLTLAWYSKMAVAVCFHSIGAPGHPHP